MTLSTSTPAVQLEPSSLLSPRFTWALVFLLLGSTTINYIDRQSLSVLAPVLREEFKLSNSDYAAVLNAFMISYTIMYGVGGWVMDKLGVRRGLSLSVIWWSVASCLQAFARGAFSLGTVFATWAIGLMLDRLHSYTPVFICIGSLLPVALIVGTLMMGKVYPLKLEAGR